MRRLITEFLLFRAIDKFPQSRFDPQVWSNEMQNAGLHDSDPWLFNFVLDGVTNGFSLQVKEGATLDKTNRNLPTTPTGDIKITKWLLDAIRKGWAIGPFKPDGIPRDLFPNGVHVNPLGAVPKPNGKIRPIVHCSAPRSGRSVNSEMYEEWKTVRYTRFIDIVRLVKEVGQNGYLWCADAADAYLQLTLKHRDTKYVAVNWLGLIVVFTVLIFGLSSAPKIYTHFADAIERIVVSNGDSTLWHGRDSIQLIRHYLDDFFGGHRDLNCANEQFDCFLRLLRTLNIPYAPHKVVRPSREQKLLGFIWDTTSMVVRIPQTKIDSITSTLKDLLRLKRKRPTKQELLSIVGKLRWFSVTMFGAQAFVRRIEQQAYSVKRLSDHVRINSGIRRDIQFWLDGFSTLKQGVSLDFLLKNPSHGDIHVYTDASGCIGMGGVSSEGYWYQTRWQSIWPGKQKIDIFFGEMLAVVVFVYCNAHRWTGKSITFHCDNEAVEWTLRRKRCTFKRNDTADLIRIMCLLAIKHRFYFWIARVATDDNGLADALSRFNNTKLNECVSSGEWTDFPLNAELSGENIRSFCSSLEYIP